MPFLREAPSLRLPGQPPSLTLTIARARRAPAVAVAATNPRPPQRRGGRRLHHHRFLHPPHAVPPAGSEELPAGTAFTRVVTPAALALALCNVDRICLAVAIVPIAAEFGWGPAVQVRGECV